MKKRNILFVSVLSLGLFSCQKEISYGQLETDFSALQSSVTISGTLNAHTTYFTNSDYNFIDETMPSKDQNFTYDLTFSYSDTYEGADRRYYEVLSDGTIFYLQGENTYNDDGYVTMNYVDYENVVYNDGYVYADEYNRTPFASSGLVNPFRLMELTDFTPTSEGTYTLNAMQSTLVFNQLFGTLDELTSDNTVSSSTFTYGENNETINVTMVSQPYNSTETVVAENKYIQTVYTANFVISNIGESNAQTLMAPEPEKAENAELQEAIDNMQISDFTLLRHLIPDDAVQQECVMVYYDKETYRVYDQVFDYVYQEGVVPTAPTAADFLMIPTDPTNGSYLVPHIYGGRYTGEGEDRVYDFSGTGYPALMGMSYQETLPLLNNDFDDYEVSANVFNRNIDGSYSPINDNLAYVASELFMSPFGDTSYTANGFTTSCKIYLRDALETENVTGKVIDHIDFRYEDTVGQTGTIILTYSDIGSTSIPFAVNI